MNGKASVIPEACVACGECVKVCPAHAKKIRSNLARLKELVASGAKLYASIAPSFAGYFKGVTIGQLAAALKAAGFAGVSETAHGAESVNAHVSKLLSETESPLVISSACPAVVDMVRKYLPGYAEFISPLPSPVRAHCHLIKEKYGSPAKVVFFGPCVAKRSEARRKDVDYVLSFEELGAILAGRKIDVIACEPWPLPRPANPTARNYARSCGVTEAVLTEAAKKIQGFKLNAQQINGIDRKTCGAVKLHAMGRTGVNSLEVMACPGGCQNGPCSLA